MKKYLIVALKVSVTPGVTLKTCGNMRPMPRLFMWHRNANTGKDDCYAFTQESNVLYSNLDKAKKAALAPSNQVLFAKNKGVAIIEIDCEEGEVVEFCKLYNFDDKQWSEAKIEFESLTESAFDDVNWYYQKNQTHCMWG